MVQLSHPYMTTGKTIALTIWAFVGNVMYEMHLKTGLWFIFLWWSTPSRTSGDQWFTAGILVRELLWVLALPLSACVTLGQCLASQHPCFLTYSILDRRPSLISLKMKLASTPPEWEYLFLSLSLFTSVLGKCKSGSPWMAQAQLSLQSPSGPHRCKSCPVSIPWLSQISPDMNINTGCGDKEVEPVWAEGAGALNDTCFERRNLSVPGTAEFIAHLPTPCVTLAVWPWLSYSPSLF